MPKRRDHGQGGLYELKSRGLWRGVIDDGFTDDGRRRQRYVHAKTREECIKKLRRLMREIEERGAPLDHRTRVVELADRWLEDAGGRLKPKTLQGYRSAMSTSVVPVLGKRVVSDLKSSDVKRLHAAVFARNVGPASVASAHRALSAMLGYAVDEGLIARNVAESVEIPRQATPNRDSLSRAEAAALLKENDALCSLALLSGARDGELRGLRIADVDLDGLRATISWNLVEVTSVHGCGGTCGFKTPGRCPARKLDLAPNLEVELLEGRWALVRPKSYRPRVVPLTPEVAAAIANELAHQSAPNPHELVWHREGGKPLTNSTTNQRLRETLAHAKIQRPATMHWLRHTYTTMAEHADIPWVVYAGVSGHASQDISRRYTHQLEQQAREGIDRLSSYLRA